MFKKRYLGLSSDLHTNRLELTCDCGKKWEPSTTMFSIRDEKCNSCKAEQFVNYNLEGDITQQNEKVA